MDDVDEEIQLDSIYIYEKIQRIQMLESRWGFVIKMWIKATHRKENRYCINGGTERRGGRRYILVDKDNGKTKCGSGRKIKKEERLVIKLQMKVYWLELMEDGQK